MGDYAPPFTITNKILTYVSSISEKIGRITGEHHRHHFKFVTSERY